MKKMAVGLVCSAILTACSHGVQIAEHADHYNNSVEQVENRMLLKNVVRASKRMPLHFTRISEVNGNVSSGIATGDIAIPQLGANGSGEAYGLVPSLKAGSNPTYKLQVLASEEFFKGVMTPVNIETMRFFVDQGWPIPILMFLFVERIDVTYEDAKGNQKTLCSIDNDPLQDQRWREFEAAINVIEARGTFRKQSKNDPIGPIYTKHDLSVKELVRINDAKFKLEDVSEKVMKNANLRRTLSRHHQPGKGKKPYIGPYFQVERPSSTEFINLDVPKINRDALDDQAKRVLEEQRGYCNELDIYMLAIEDGENLAKRFLEREPQKLQDIKDRISTYVANTKKGDPETTIHARLQLRPALNQIYYLGELVRYQRQRKSPRISKLLARDCAEANSDGSCKRWERGEDDRVRELNNPMALFNSTTDEAEFPAIRVNVTNETYSIPGYPDVGRSTQFLTLVRQIFQLNIKEENFPSSQTVQLVTRTN